MESEITITMKLEKGMLEQQKRFADLKTAADILAELSTVMENFGIEAAKREEMKRQIMSMALTAIDALQCDCHNEGKPKKVGVPK